jgi:hypothetical protein
VLLISQVHRPAALQASVLSALSHLKHLRLSAGGCQFQGSLGAVLSQLTGLHSLHVESVDLKVGERKW